MQQHITHIALVVDDYDDAIQFYTAKLHFKLVEDTVLSETKRWVLVSPPGTGKSALYYLPELPKMMYNVFSIGH